MFTLVDSVVAGRILTRRLAGLTMRTTTFTKVRCSTTPDSVPRPRSKTGATAFAIPVAFAIGCGSSSESPNQLTAAGDEPVFEMASTGSDTSDMPACSEQSAGNSAVVDVDAASSWWRMDPPVAYSGEARIERLPDDETVRIVFERDEMVGRELLLNIERPSFVSGLESGATVYVKLLGRDTSLVNSSPTYVAVLDSQGTLLAAEYAGPSSAEQLREVVAAGGFELALRAACTFEPSTPSCLTDGAGVRLGLTIGDSQELFEGESGTVELNDESYAVGVDVARRTTGTPSSICDDFEGPTERLEFSMLRLQP